MGKRIVEFGVLWEPDPYPGRPSPIARALFPDNDINLARICPYLVQTKLFDRVEASEFAQALWLNENARSYWIRWVKGFYFNDQNDAFAFLLRWGT